MPEVPDPLHPALVHLPIALAVLVPGFALLGILSIRRGLLPARTWAVVLLLQALLVLSGWLALETGEDQEERVERVVAERHIEAHEEAAERFQWIALATLAACVAGLLPARRGEVARLAALALAALGLVAGVSVGHSGGALVYEHGAAAAYVAPQAGGGESVGRVPSRTAAHGPRVAGE